MVWWRSIECWRMWIRWWRLRKLRQIYVWSWPDFWSAISIFRDFPAYAAAGTNIWIIKVGIYLLLFHESLFDLLTSFFGRTYILLHQHTHTHTYIDIYIYTQRKKQAQKKHTSIKAQKVKNACTHLSMHIWKHTNTQKEKQTMKNDAHTEERKSNEEKLTRKRTKNWDKVCEKTNTENKTQAQYIN